MNIETVMTMPPDTLAREAATKVMGWAHSSSLNGGEWFEPPHGQHLVSHRWTPGTCCDDDYRVLEHVREKWTSEQLFDLQRHLGRFAKQRIPTHVPLGLRYRPGDYARAALLAIGEPT